MKDNQGKGVLGETLAKEYLLGRGYSILESRYRTRQGEVDLIAEKDKTLVFIEVKARTGQRYGRPAEAVTKQKQRHLTSAALAYLQQTGRESAVCRFDVMEVFLPKGHVCHIQGAFDACM